MFSGDLYLFNLDQNLAFVSGVMKHFIHLCSRHHMVRAPLWESSELLAGASRPPRPCSRSGGHTRWPSRSCEDTGRGARGDVLAGATPEAQPAWQSLFTVGTMCRSPLGRRKTPCSPFSIPLCGSWSPWQVLLVSLEQRVRWRCSVGSCRPSPALGHSGRMLWGWIWLFAAD